MIQTGQIISLKKLLRLGLNDKSRQEVSWRLVAFSKKAMALKNPRQLINQGIVAGKREQDSAPLTQRVDRFLCGKTLMKKALLKRYLVSEATRRYGSRNSERNPLKSSPNRNLRLGTSRDVDQLVDRLVWDQEAVGSSPAIPTNLGQIKFKLKFSNVSTYYSKSIV